MYLVIFLSFCLSFSTVADGSSNCTGTSSLITFDDLPVTISSALISNGYFGLNWFNVYYILVSSTASGSGYHTALSSGSYGILNGYGNTMIISSPTAAVFNISSFTAAAAWNDNLHLSVNGQRNGTTIYQQTIILQVTTSSLVVLNWTHIDTISFSTSGGTVNPMFAGTYSGIEFAMDNLCADISLFYTTTQAHTTSSVTSGSGGGGNGGGSNGGGGGNDDGVDIGIAAGFGGDTGVGLTVGELSTPLIGGIVGAVIGALIILGLFLWCLITSKCGQQAPNCNGCGGGGC